MKIASPAAVCQSAVRETRTRKNEANRRFGARALSGDRVKGRLSGRPWADFHTMLGRRLCTRVRQEKADHLPAGVGSARVSVGATGAAAGPSMAGAVKGPLWEA
jgi:hypothetical protein